MHIGLEVENKMIKMIQQKKNDTTAMATAINQDLLSDYMKIVMV